MPGLRLLLLNYEFPPLGGGAGTATAEMARAYAAAGHDVVVLTSAFRGLAREERVGGARVLRVPVIRRRPDRCTPLEMLTYVGSAARSALRLVRTWRPDLAIAFFGIPSGPVGWLLKRRHGIPLVISLRGGDVPGFEWAPGVSIYHRLTGALIRGLWRSADAVVANGAGLRDLAAATAPDVPVAVVPNGVDAARHAPGEAPPSADSGAPTRLLLVGRLTHQKGADLLLAAAARLKLPYVLDIVGDGPDRQALSALAQRLGVADHVHFHGWVGRDEMPARYRAADVFVFPSRIEGIPNVVLEAMAYALPVVATRVAGNTDLVVEGETGLLVPPADVAALAAALEGVLADAALRRRLGAAGRARVLAQFTWTAAAQAYLHAAAARCPAFAASLRRVTPAAPGDTVAPAGSAASAVVGALERA